MKKQKSGISLIVLVITIIVIIILAVAVILSIANNNPIENAKEARIRNDLKAIEEELTVKQASNYVDEHTGKGTSQPIEISDLASAANYTDKLTIRDGKICIKSGSFENEEKLSEELGIDIVQEVTLKLGDEITYKNEPFYVIGGDTVGTEISDSTQNVLLLAKYNLTSDGNNQDKTGESNECKFSSTNYWSSETSCPEDLNNFPISEGVTSIIAIAKAYGESLGAKEGRLMTYKEVQSLQTNYSAILYGKNTEKGYLNYWLCNVVEASPRWNYVEVVFGSGATSSLSFEDSSQCGIRPVITVLTSSIK